MTDDGLLDRGRAGGSAVSHRRGLPARLPDAMGSLIKKRRKRMRKKKHKKMLKRTRFQRRAAGK
jgi:Mitochondrial domain of unknown function (DUF1713)